jgi:tetratricopeptide (TPR) repeat protein
MTVTAAELQDLVLRNAAELSEVRRQISDLISKEKRVEATIRDLQRRMGDYLKGFDRDKYKGTDPRLSVAFLAHEILILERLGYDLGNPGADFILGVAAILEGRNFAALEEFKRFLASADQADRNVQNASYLAAMICYNRREPSQAIEHFSEAFRYSPEKRRDWQSAIYVGELQYFRRDPKEVVDKTFFDIECELKRIERQPEHNVLRGTLYLKWGNCYAGTFLPPLQTNGMVNNGVAVAFFKQAKKYCPFFAGAESMLPVVIDYSLAQSLLLADSVDMEIEKTPSELLADVFHRLRKILLNKREEIILAQGYFMLATCAYYSEHISKDIGEIYLEYARHQTLTVPSDVSFYSCITKELLSRDEFVKQIDFYAGRFEQSSYRR